MAWIPEVLTFPDFPDPAVIGSLVKATGEKDTCIVYFFLMIQQNLRFFGRLLKTEQDYQIFFGEKIHILKKFRAARRQQNSPDAESGQPEVRQVGQGEGGTFGI